jgi:mycofactocin glycosyltransferase
VMRYRLDRSVERHGNVVIGGSPLKLFRLTAGGVAVVDRIGRGEAVAPSVLVERLLDAGAIHPLPDPLPDPRLEADAVLRFAVSDVTTVIPVRGDLRHAPDGAIVVDDASPTPVAGATIRLPTGVGPAGARMAGLEHVTTPLVAFVDSDVTLPAGWLDGLLPHFDDPRVGLVAPRVRSTPGASALERYEVKRSPLDLGPEPARIRAGTRVSYVPAAAIVVRVDAIRQLGGFDLDIRFGEDVDLVWRLDEAGWSCRYEPAVEVEHRPRSTWRAWLRQRIDYGSSAAPLARRHPGRLAPVRMSGWSAGSWGLAATGHPFAGVALGAGSAAALVPKLDDVPPAVALRIAGLGNLHAGQLLADAVRRVWWPIVLIAALRSRRARLIAIASLLPLRHPVCLADDMAYGIGVWKGVWTERIIDPLIPRFAAWPGRPSRTVRTDAPTVST